MNETTATARPSAPVTPAPGASLPLAALVLAICAYLVHGIVTMDVPATASSPGPRFFPVIVAVLAGVVGLALAVQGLRQRRTTRTPTASEVADRADARIAWGPVLIVSGSFLLFLLVLEPVGWLLSAALLFFGVVVGLGSRRWLRDAGVALVFSAVVQLAFSAGLGLPLPAGVLGGL